MFSIVKRRNFWVMVGLDALLCFAAYYGAYLIRFDVLSGEDLAAFGATVLWIVPLKLVLLFSFKMYRGMWRYTSVHDLLNLLKALSASTGLVVFGVLSFYRFEGFSRGVFIIDFLLSVIFLGGCRLGLRVAAGYMKGKGLGNGADNQQAPLRRLVIIGAGSAGEKLLREVNENRRLTYEVVGFVDDNLSKLKLTIHGVPVLGPLENLKTIVRDFAVDELIIAVPSASATEMRRIVNFCKGSNTPFKTVPGIGELIEGRVSVSAIREVRYEDLLGRQQVDIDVNEVGQFVTGKSVLVTGAAGSIGSELCRQIARFRPSLLCLLDRNESGLYEMEMEFRTNYPGIKVLPVLAAIQNRPLMQKFFDVHRAQVVFHAAAYKHVPMMELYPWEAIFNNVTGTETLLNLCVENKVEKCVIVSTDKAVRPTNVMGACKRLTELLAMAYAKENHCRFMAVRFGNVIGSVGSVVPLFRKQIAQGGPVTVTHKNITRYFMTIPEACRLILQAGAIGRGGEIFVLKMGTPIRIDSLARDMITLSGLKPDEDINIEYIGLRPGEKLFEELITHDESVVPTQHDKITVLSSQKEVSIKTLSDQISDLMQIAYSWDSQAIRNQLSIMVDEYKPQSEGKEQGAWSMEHGADIVVPPIVVGKTARPEDGDGRVNAGRPTARILVVDDEKAVADVISDYLDTFGYSSSTSYSGAEGLKALEQQHYDLVIADLILNDMSGIDFLEEIKKRGGKVGVIIMTGYATIDSGIEAIEKGARDYIAKPLDFPELTKVIDRALSRTRAA